MQALKAVEGGEASRNSSIVGVIGIVMLRWWVVLLAGLVGSVLAVAVCLVQTPVYESSAQLYVTSGIGSDSATAAYQGSMASQQRVASYVDLVTSDAVLRNALAGSPLSMSVADASSHVFAESKPETVLLTVSAKDSDPVSAAALANAVAKSLVSYVDSLERPSNGSAPLAKLTVVTPAVAAASPVSPDVLSLVAYGFIGGIAVGCCIVFILFRIDNRISDETELSRVSGLAVLSSIEYDEGSKGSRLLARPSSVGSEGFRRLRVNLAFSRVDDPPRSLLVTSASEAEGKSTVSVNLAIALAEAGASVILVDADLRRPTIAPSLGLSADFGLTSVLLDSAKLEDVVQSTDFTGLSVLGSGPIPPNPSELLGSRRALDVASSLREGFDFAVFDSPPILPVADALEGAQWVDGVIVVARSGVTTRQELSTAVDRLETVGAQVLGCVLNSVSAKRWDRGYSYYERVEDARSAL